MMILATELLAREAPWRSRQSLWVLLSLSILIVLAAAAAVTFGPHWARTAAPEIVARLRQQHGAFIAGGQGPLKPDVFRIGHIGYLDGVDLLGLLAVLERVLRELGHPVERGACVAAASASLDRETTSRSGIA